MAELSLFPLKKPTQTGMLDVGDGDSLYWLETGCPEGIPVLILHGGPGTGMRPIQRQLFDPDTYRIVSFDQRACGRSITEDILYCNDTQHLVSDIESLREHLDIDKWLICGGSWGSTLALAYGAAYPHRCSGFLLRGIFLCRDEEINGWFYGMREVFPENWEKFACFIPEAERSDLLSAYQRRLQDPETAFAAAMAWKEYERACSTLLPLDNVETEVSDDSASIVTARVHAHYFENHFFLNEQELLGGVERISHLPAILIHGRYDMVCPVYNAFLLKRIWERATLRVIPDAGHSINEPGIKQAMLESAELFKPKLAG